MIGQKIGPYEVVAELGRGGMGEVYRARDTKLNRIVAIKSLQASVAGDAERIARFEREAQLLASLNHPNIAAIHGLQESEGKTYLVLEFVDGKPLDAVLRERALPLEEALPIARQIADAIAAAHEKGIIHRDLKPGNVMITDEGQVKVLDFGLGKAIAPEGANATGDAANSPTITVGATQAGIILGTAAYMSPEQAKGKPVDRRSDVWSFGCVLFEILTGRRAFQGDDVSDTLASVLKESPDFSRLPAEVPPSIRLVVERCLTKDRAARIADMSTVRFLLTDPSVSSFSTTSAMPAIPTPARTPTYRSPTFWMVMTLMSIVVTIAILIAYITRTASPSTAAASAFHVSIQLPTGEALSGPELQPFALSPDGQHIVYAAGSPKSKLYVRDLTGLTSREIAGTEGASYPFFSPNGQWVGFFAQNKLKKASIGGGSVDTIINTGNARGASWSEDGYIYYAQSNLGVLSRVPESGGDAKEVTRLDSASGEISHRDPQVLPGGKAILFTVWKGPGPDEKFVAVQALGDGGKSHRILIRGGADGKYVAPGYLVYARSDQLYAVPFDLSALDVAKTAPVQLEELIVGESTEAAAFTVSVSGTGTLAYLPATPTRYQRRIVWQDASGNVQPLPLPNRSYEQIMLAPDGASAIVQIIDGSVGLWRLDLAQMTLTPLVTSGGSSQSPAWTHDSKRVIYRATRNGVRNLYWKAADGTGDEERLATKPGFVQTPSSVTPDGEWVIFNESGSQTDRGIHQLRLSGSRETLEISKQASDGNPILSPNGKWLAFEDITALEIYVRAYPGPGPRILVTRNGGTEPRWSTDGTKLYFLRGDSLWVVDVSTGGTFSAGAPRLVINGGFIISPNGVTSYAVTKDGRFLHVQSTTPEAPPDTINLVLNWGAELARVVK